MNRNLYKLPTHFLYDIMPNGKKVNEPAMIGMLPDPSPQWWEMINWDEKDATLWRKLAEETRQKVRDCGKAPKYDRVNDPIFVVYGCGNIPDTEPDTDQNTIYYSMNGVE